MTQQAPQLSVVMSVYNGEDFVADAIQCILDQTYTDFELVLINDGSKDGSLAIMQEFADRDSRIRIIDQANTGLTIALRRGVDAARGTYIARMDVDDISTPDRFEKQMELAAARPELVAITSDVEHFFEDGSPSVTAQLRVDPRLLPLYLVFSNRIGGHGQMVYRKDAYLACGGYDPDYNFSEDYDLWTRLIEQGPFGVVPKTLYRYRSGHESISSLNAVRQSAVAGRICRRQFHKLTGEDIDEATSDGIRVFWRNFLLTGITPQQMKSVSSAMNKAVNAFFEQNPSLADHEAEVRRKIAAKWWWRRKHLPAGDFARWSVLLANVLQWSGSALLARGRAR